MFQSIKRIIPQSLHSSGIDAQVSASVVVTEAKKALERLWGMERASYIEPLSFIAGTLFVRMNSPSAAQAVRTIEIQWMNEVNRVIGQRKVMKIQVRT
jgi:hypothetical protein